MCSIFFFSYSFSCTLDQPKQNLATRNGNIAKFCIKYGEVGCATSGSVLKWEKHAISFMYFFYFIDFVLCQVLTT